MRKLIYILFLFAVLITFPVSKSPAAWENKIGLGVNVYDGNTNKGIYSGLVEIENKTLTNKTKLKGEYLYTEEDNKKDGEKVYLEEIFNQNITKRIYFLGNSSFKYDYKEELERRLILSSGLGLRLVKLANMELAIEGGASYLVEKYDDRHVDDDGTLRFAGIVDILLLPKVSVDGRVEYFPDVKKKNDYIIKGEVNINAQANDSISFRVTLRNDYVHIPLEGKEKNDFVLSSAIIYEF